MKAPLRSAAIVLTFLFTLLGLTPACQELASGVDCSLVCDKQHDCYESNLDEGRCRDRCNDRAGNDVRFERRASDCGDCIRKNNNCAELGDRCESVCAPVREDLGLAKST